MTSRHAFALHFAACFLGAGPAHAGSKNLDEAAKEPSYEAKKVLCSGGDCKAIVMNHNGVGVMVEGEDKQKTQKKAEKKAKELNEEAEEGTISSDNKDELFDVCKMFPDMC